MCVASCLEGGFELRVEAGLRGVCGFLGWFQGAGLLEFKVSGSRALMGLRVSGYPPKPAQGVGPAAWVSDWVFGLFG